MRIDRSHRPWVIFVTFATGCSALLYLANFHPRSLPFPIGLPAFFGEAPPPINTHGGTPLGLIFGSIAYLIFLFASALGIRKKKRVWRIGNVQFWLKAHIWLTILTIPLILFHCGFHGGGKHTTWLLILYILVMGSGFFGLALQQFLPRLMKESLPREVVFEQIPHICTLLLEEATKIRNGIRELESAPLGNPRRGVAAHGAPPSESIVETAPRLQDISVQVLSRFLDDQCLPYLAAERGDRHPLGDLRVAEGIFRTLKLGVADQWLQKVEDLQTWCDDRRLMDLQTKLQHWLHGWLILHVPASFALLVFTTWHACVAVRFLVRLQ